MIHHPITVTWCDFAQPSGPLRPHFICGSLVLVAMFFSRLQQVMIQFILRQCIFWGIPPTRGTSSNSVVSLGFIPVICISVSLSQSTNPSSCLTQVDDTFLGSFHNNPQPDVAFAEPDLRSGSLLPRYST